MRPRLALLASPLLGPAVWVRVARELTRHGRDVLLPGPYGAVTGPADVLDHLLGEIPDEPVVLVPHSNAGLYVAALAAQRDVRGLVFVDAGLPGDSTTTPTTPPGFRAYLDALADGEGRLPGWTGWWPSEEVDALFPDASARAAVEAEQGRLPLAYFDAEVPSPPGWRDLPAAYLAFGDTYGAERDVADARRWPTRTLSGEHLHLLNDPVEVSDALLGLVGQLGLP